MKAAAKVLPLLLLLLLSNTSFAQIVAGYSKAYDPAGMQIFNAPTNADIDLNAGTMTIDPVIFFGQQVNVTSIELLGQGSHTRPIGTVNVGPDQLGAYMIINWAVSEFRLFMVWDMLTDGINISLTPTDSDGDGIPGHALIEGPFPGFTFVYEFLSPDLLPPGIEVTMNIVNGTSYRQCDTHGGSQVTMAADITLKGEAELGSILWYLNDVEVASNEEQVDLIIPVGSHTVRVDVSTLTGQTDTASMNLVVNDNTAPDVEIVFTDKRSGAIVTEIEGNQRHFIIPHITTTDICDPNPTSHAVASAVNEITEDTVININAKRSDVYIPATGVEVRVTAADENGNSKTESAILPIN